MPQEEAKLRWEKKQQGEMKREINEQNKNCKDNETVADAQSLLEAVKVELLLQNVRTVTGKADSRPSTRVYYGNNMKKISFLKTLRANSGFLIRDRL